MPILRDLAARYKDRGLEVVAISVQETSPADVKAYAAKYQLAYTIGFDGSGKIFHAYKAYGLPTQVFIDANGVIRRSSARRSTRPARPRRSRRSCPAAERRPTVPLLGADPVHAHPALGHRVQLAVLRLPRTT